MRDKIVSAEAAVALINDGDTLTTSGFVGIGVPDGLLAALAKRFADTGAPRGLTLFFAAGQGDGKERGLNRLSADGLLRRVVGGHWGLIPKIGQQALAGQIEAYNLPQGVISHLYREIAGGKPGVLTKVGLDTFVDPRVEGGKINDCTTDDLVELMTIGGEPHLFYKAFPIDVAFLRGTTADQMGNVTMEREALILDNFSQAAAARNSGGLVIVQVERVAAARSLSPRDVVIPGALVDAVVVAEPELHMQTYATAFSHTFTGAFRAPAPHVDKSASAKKAARAASQASSLDIRKIIARRAAFELPVNGVVNLGIGMPEGVAAVAGEEGLLEHVTLTAEPGVVGGQPASGLDFGAAENTDAIVTQSQQFDFYDGGGLDLACLGMAEVDKRGNVNVSRFGPKLAGAGGFINISQNARSVVFAGAFSAGGLNVRVADCALQIVDEGRAPKFHEAVEQITFSGARAAGLGRRVLYVTERCVFALEKRGLAVVEVAPGVDLEKDVIAHMAFAPIVEDVVEMDRRIFAEEPMGLRIDLLNLDLEDRIQLEPEHDRLFLNFEKYRVRVVADVDAIRERVVEVCEPHGRRVDVVANYDGAQIDDDVIDAFVEMVRTLEDRYYRTVTRYSGSAFMRVKLGRSFERETAPHIFETASEAKAFLERLSISESR